MTLIYMELGLLDSVHSLLEFIHINELYNIWGLKTGTCL